MTAGEWLTVGGIGLLVLAAAVFAAAETALSRTTRVHALHLEEQGRRGAGLLVRITSDPARYLNPILVATLICHVLGTTLATTLALRRLGSVGEIVATAVMTTVIFVFAESAPKTFAVQHTDRVALPLAAVIYGVGRLLYPLTRVLIGISNVILPGKGLPRGPFMTEEEVRHIVEVAGSEEVIEEEERKMISSIFELGDTVVREVMVPRPDMVVVSAEATVGEAMEVAIREGFSRIPVYEGEPGNIVGVVYAKDMFRAMSRSERDRKVSEVMRKAYFVPDSKKVSDLLREMQKNKVHMAIVVDEYGDVDGLVTLEDLLEEIVGEIADEYDVEEPAAVPVDERTWRVKGRMAVGELNELLGMRLPDDEWDTVGGLVVGVLGKVPAEGEEVVFQGLKFRAEKVTGRRIETALITRLDQHAGELHSA